jgi:hypothetical protein
MVATCYRSLQGTKPDRLIADPKPFLVMDGCIRLAKAKFAMIFKKDSHKSLNLT